MDGRARQRELTSLCPGCRRNLQISTCLSASSRAFLARWGLFCLHTVFENDPSNVDVYPAAGATSVIPIKQSQPPPDHRRHHQAIIIACAAPFKNNFVRERDLPRFASSSFPIYPYILRQSGVGGGWLDGWFEPLVSFLRKHDACVKDVPGGQRPSVPYPRPDILL